MSYILDALRKAERDRQLSRVPTLVTAHGSVESIRRPPWLWAFTGALALSAVVASGIFLASRHPAPPREVAPSPPVAADAASGARVRTAVPHAAERVPDGNEATAPRAVGPAVDHSPSVRVPERPRPAPASPPASPRSPGTAAGPTETPEASAAADADLPSATAPTRRAGVPSAAATSGGEAASAPAGAPPGPDPGAARGEPPMAAQPIARLALDVLVYSDVAAERFVFINGRKYVEGQTVDGDAIVEQITPSGAVLRQQGRQVLLQPKLNPYVRP